MPGFEIGEEIARGADPAFPHVFAALADPFTGIMPGCDVEEPLVGRGCLNDQLKAKVDEVNPTLTTPPIDAKSSDLKVGTVNVPGVQQQYGKNFGKSVIPYRPPPPIYGGIGGRR